MIKNKGEQMKKEDQQLIDCHQATMRHMEQMLKLYDAQIVASSLLAISLRLYKTILRPEDFQKFVEVVEASAKDVEDFYRPTIN